MSKKKSFTVDDAYALETPADSVRLYADWASTYDSDFVAETGYILHRQVANAFLRQEPDLRGPVLDVGCGTGVVGIELRNAGVVLVDGIDISEPMLAEAGGKTSAAGEPVYRRLIAADLTKKLDISSDTYAGLISAGTFTLGHVGPDALDELWRVAAPGAVCAISIRTTHYEQAGFADKLATHVAGGIISQPDLVEIPIYRPRSGGSEHDNDRALVVVCRIAR